MTEPGDFSAEDWALLNRAPTAVVMAASYAEQDGMLALSKEMKAGMQAAIDGATAFPDNALIQALCNGMQEVDSSDDQIEGGVQAGEGEDAEDVMEERSPERSQASSIELARQAMDLLNANATPREAIEFKHWLYAIADQVTLGAKTGGMLGFGGTQVSEGELEYLTALKDAIGMDANGE